MRFLTPDYYFEKYTDITPEFLAGIGCRVLLTDLDNTLAPYEQPDADERHVAFFAALAEAGISAVLISNNDGARLERFNASLGLPAYAKSGKPSPRFLRRAMKRCGGVKKDTVMLGDQLLTDTLAGRLAGVTCIVVPPINDRRDAFTRFKRFLERPFIKRLLKKQKTKITKRNDL